MTATETMTENTTTWNEQLAALKARQPSVRDPILAAMNIMTMEPNITIDDAKAQAALHGVRNTAASVNAAVKMLATAQASVATTVPATAANAEPAPQRQARRAPPAAGNLDTEALIRQVVGRMLHAAACCHHPRPSLTRRTSFWTTRHYRACATTPARALRPPRTSLAGCR